MPCCASFHAAQSPASPAPMTTTSGLRAAAGKRSDIGAMPAAPASTMPRRSNARRCSRICVRVAASRRRASRANSSSGESGSGRLRKARHCTSRMSALRAMRPPDYDWPQAVERRCLLLPRAASHASTGRSNLPTDADAGDVPRDQARPGDAKTDGVAAGKYGERNIADPLDATGWPMLLRDAAARQPPVRSRQRPRNRISTAPPPPACRGASQ